MNQTAKGEKTSVVDARDFATIRSSAPLVTFVQIWELPGANAQERWLEVMHESIHILRSKPGFVSMSLHKSLDGNRIAVYAQWATRETLETAITNPDAIAAHDRMAAIGTSDGSLYAVDRVYGRER
jgi:quinol monooxygenase YgiN